MLWPPLLAYAHWLEQELRLEEALDTVETALGLRDGTAPTEEIAALLQRGRILRQLGRFDEARASYQAGRTKAAEVGDKHSELLGRIGDAIVLRQVGNLSGSEKALHTILRDAGALGDPDAEARAHHDLAVALAHRAKEPEAVRHLYRAFELYELPADKLRALSDVGETLKRGGQWDAAHDAFNVVLREAQSPQVRAATMIALLELSTLRRDRLAFARWTNEITALGEELPAERQVDLAFQLGLGHAAFGHARKAQRCLAEALLLAEQYRLNEYVFRIQDTLEKVKRNFTRDGTRFVDPSRADGAKEFAEVVGKLRALRAG